MRIATMIISLILTLIVGLQSCTLYAGGSMTRDQGISGGGAIGIVIALLFLIGGAFAMGVPKLSTFAFGLAGLLGIAVGSGGTFRDLTIWGVVAIILAVMSYFGDRELRQNKGSK